MSDDLDNLQKCLLECQNNDLRSMNNELKKELKEQTKLIEAKEKKRVVKFIN